MVKLTAEIADGWLPMGFVPGAMEEYGPWLEEGFRRAGNGKSLKDFTIQASVHVEVDSDVKGALTRPKPEVALYVDGMGHRTKNFHNDIMLAGSATSPSASRNCTSPATRTKPSLPCLTSGSI